MKKISLLAFILVFVFVGTAMAEFAIGLQKVQFSNVGTDTNLRSDLPQLRVSLGLSNYFGLFSTIERVQLSMIGQSAFEINIAGVGISYQHKLNDIFSAHIDAGIYGHWWEETHSGNEGMYYLTNKVLGRSPFKKFDEYQVTQTDPTLGLTIGFKAKASNHITIDVGYRHLTLPYNITGWNPGCNDDGYWTFDRSINASGYYVGCSVVF